MTRLPHGGPFAMRPKPKVISSSGRIENIPMLQYRDHLITVHELRSDQWQVQINGRMQGPHEFDPHLEYDIRGFWWTRFWAWLRHLQGQDVHKYQCFDTALHLALTWVDEKCEIERQATERIERIAARMEIAQEVTKVLG